MEKFPKYGGFGHLGLSILGSYDNVGVSGVSLPATSWCWGCLASGRGLCELEVVGGGGGSTECSLRVASAQLGLCCPAAAAVPGPARDGAICQTRVDYIFEQKISESKEFCRLNYKHNHCQTKYFMQWVGKMASQNCGKERNPWGVSWYWLTSNKGGIAQHYEHFSLNSQLWSQNVIETKK